MFNPAKRKQQIRNGIMVVVIGLILTAGILMVGGLKGWFDGNAPVQITQADGTTKTVTLSVSNKLGKDVYKRQPRCSSLRSTKAYASNVCILVPTTTNRRLLR